ncbi:DUF3152 domain-containing protein [Virgisporangium ochraceum]|uniref:DUF3152 domain-containing protein n=1 Tax=Virgisporangium ochraceum TaxID=65505 RepID=UPI001941DD72|nr:DUF3152 domain-containing protein [Virgisporangium ochraceum]
MGSILLRFVAAAAVLLAAGAAVGSRLGSTFAGNGTSVPAHPYVVAPASTTPSAPRSTPESPPPATRPASRATAVPTTGTGAFTAAAAAGEVRGTAGRLHRYRVTVEDGTGQDPVEVAAIIDAVLGDPRGWTAGGRIRLQLVPGDAPADFTVLLATARTSEAICATGGLRTEGYSSCRLPGRVVLNLSRWLTAVPNYGATLDEYRQYLVNHEVGHQLGQGHEACPGRGQPAPVMQQQTYGLDGCVANAWPYIGGRRYSGRAVK